MKGRTLWTKFALAGLGLRWFGGFKIVSKKWTDQCEDCSLKKNKTGTSQVGAIPKAQKYSMNNYWKHLEKIIFQGKIIFGKKIFKKRKRSHNAENSKEAIQAHSTFSQQKTSKKMQGGTL